MCSTYMKMEPIAHTSNTTSKCTHTHLQDSPIVSIGMEISSYVIHHVHGVCKNSNVPVKQRVGSKITCRAGAISTSCFIYCYML